jgi:hypothetical protein
MLWQPQTGFVLGRAAIDASGGIVGGTLDPTHTGSNLVLSNGNLTVTNSTSNLGVAMSVTGHSSGKWYFEYTCVTGQTGSTGYYQSIGICQSGFPYNTGLAGGSIGLSVGLRDDTSGQGSVYLNGTVTSVNNIGLSVGVGQTGACAIDLTNTLIWFKGPGWSNLWYFSGGNAPDGAGGINFSTVTPSPFYVAAGNAFGAKYTVNLIGTSPAYTPPAGYNWWG